MPYQSPYVQYPTYPYPTYSPYQNQMPNNQPMMNNAPPAMQYQPQNAAPVQQMNGLNGKFVDSIESVKATDVMMDGSIMFFPATDGKAIYTKQLQADGTSRVLTYTVAEQAQTEDNKPSILEAVESRLTAFQRDINSGFEEISDRFDRIDRQLKTAKAARGEKEA